jgi:hypothetical protein
VSGKSMNSPLMYAIVASYGPGVRSLRAARVAGIFRPMGRELE